MPPSLRKLIDSWYPGYHGTLGTRAFTLIDPVSWHGVRPATSGTDKLNKAFTLIELLIVISILSILGSAISIVLNPAELLAEARDSQRINDLESLRNSLSLTLIDNPSLFDSLSNTSIYLSLPVSSCLTNPPSGYTYICNATSLNLQKTDSTGWLPLSLTNLPIFPIDPINSSSSSLYYAFVPDLTNKTFVLTSLLESEKYLKLSALKDGGTDPGRIEEGNPTLWTAASGLVGYWPMDEGSGSVAGDLSGNGNTGTVSSATYVLGKRGMALQIGLSGSVSVPGSPSLNITGNLSEVFWIKRSGIPTGWERVTNKGGDCVTNNRSYIVSLYPNVGSAFFSYMNCGGLSSTTSVANGNWMHVAIVHSTNDYIYINGVLEAQRVSIGNPVLSSGSFIFGSNNQYLDEMTVFNRALSAAEIQAIYTAQQ